MVLKNKAKLAKNMVAENMASQSTEVERHLSLPSPCLLSGIQWKNNKAIGTNWNTGNSI